MKKQKHHPLGKRIGALFAAAVLFLSLWTLWQNLTFTVTEYRLAFDDLPGNFDGFRILQISDLHNRAYSSDNHELIRQAQEAAPDIIVFTGDAVDSSRYEPAVTVSLAKAMLQIAPVYFVSGNHEYGLRNRERKRLYAELSEAGAIILDNKAVVIERGDERISLFGMPDSNFFHGDRNEKMQQAFQSLKAEDAFNILLFHRPEIELIADFGNVDLMLSGHAHGGQVCLPLLGGLYTPTKGWFPKYTAGVYTWDDTRMVVSRGLGNSSFPVRFNNPFEMVLTVLCCE